MLFTYVLYVCKNESRYVLRRLLLCCETRCALNLLQLEPSQRGDSSFNHPHHYHHTHINTNTHGRAQHGSLQVSLRCLPLSFTVFTDSCLPNFCYEDPTLPILLLRHFQISVTNHFTVIFLHLLFFFFF